jgi:nitroreductase
MTVIEQVDELAPPAAAVLTALRERRSSGRVQQTPPPRATIEQLLDAATWAPNHRLTEPWRFVVLTGDARGELGAVMAAAQQRAANGVAPTEEQLARTRAKPLRAPVIIAVAAEPAQRANVVEIEEIAAVAAATQNLLLAAHALGLGAIWRTGDAAYDPAVKAFLGLAPECHLLGFVYVGYPDTAPAAPRAARTPATALTRWLS